MTQYNKAILAAAEEYMGLEEWPGAKHNPVILDMFAKSGHSWVEDDETPWCAAFVGAILAQLGIPATGKLNARSYQNWGTHVDINAAQPGDVVTLWRGSPQSWMGHVAIFVGFADDDVILRGGNQGNKVSDARYPRSRILAIRRADGVGEGTVRPTVRNKSKGAYVLEAQTILDRLGYHVGMKDGKFGTRTFGAVVEFQKDHDLEPDGIIGDETWSKLLTADKRPLRDVPEDYVRKNSRTVGEAEKGKKTVTGLGVGAGVAVAVDQLEQVTELAREAEGVLEVLKGIAPGAIAIVLLAVLVWLVVKNFDKITFFRVDDAKTGANDKY